MNHNDSLSDDEYSCDPDGLLVGFGKRAQDENDYDSDATGEISQYSVSSAVSSKFSLFTSRVKEKTGFMNKKNSKTRTLGQAENDSGDLFNKTASFERLGNLHEFSSSNNESTKEKTSTTDFDQEQSNEANTASTHMNYYRTASEETVVPLSNSKQAKKKNAYSVSPVCTPDALSISSPSSSEVTPKIRPSHTHNDHNFIDNEKGLGRKLPKTASQNSTFSDITIPARNTRDRTHRLDEDNDISPPVNHDPKNVDTDDKENQTLKESSEIKSVMNSDEKSRDGSTNKVDKRRANRTMVVSGRSELYLKRSVTKSEASRKLIRSVIDENILFKSCQRSYLDEFVDVFVNVQVDKDSLIIKQGDEGNCFFIIEDGSVNIFINDKLVNCLDKPGCAFGEVALLYNSPRNATVRAKTSCILWSIHRRDYQGLFRSLNKNKSEYKIEFLRKVKIGNHKLGDLLDKSEIYNMALAIKTLSYNTGDVIVKEGEKGDTFYIIEHGNVDVFIEAVGENPIITMCAGQYFGEKALFLEEGLRTATCVASSPVRCYCLTREDFTHIMGEVEWTLDGYYEERMKKVERRRSSATISVAPGTTYLQPIADFPDISELQMSHVIGVGYMAEVKFATWVDPKSNDERAYAVKCLDMNIIRERKLMEHLKCEKEIMLNHQHPFIAQIFADFEVGHMKYFVMELLPGGDLLRLLREKDSLPEQWVQFYSASVVTVFITIHSNHVAYRDLKPENLVLDASGYVKLIDFGLAKVVENGKTWTFCGSPDYMASEIILNEGHDWAVDYWCLGILIFELIAGCPPFSSDHPMDVYQKILGGSVEMPETFSSKVVDLIQKLLNPMQSARLGRSHSGANEILKHKWYSHIDKDCLLGRQYEAPWVPNLNGLDDLRYFDNFPNEQTHKQSSSKSLSLDSETEVIDSIDLLPQEASGGSSSTLRNSTKHTIGKQNRHLQTLSNALPVKRFSFTNLGNQHRPISVSRSNSLDPYLQLKTEKRESFNKGTFKPVFNRFNSRHDEERLSTGSTDSVLMAQIMNLANAVKKQDEYIDALPFTTFALLSVQPETVLVHYSAVDNDTNKNIYKGARYLDPFFLHSADVVDQFPDSFSSELNEKPLAFSPEALSAFCFPNGVSIRLLPRHAVEGASRLKWLGKDSYRYQLHAFTNQSGERSHGISITTKEEIFCSHADSSRLVQILSELRDEDRAARTIVRYLTEWLKRISKKTTNSSSQKTRWNLNIRWSEQQSNSHRSLQNKPDQLDKISTNWNLGRKLETKPEGKRAGTESQLKALVSFMKNPLARGSSPAETEINSVLPGCPSENDGDVSCDTKTTTSSARRHAAEAYRYMLESDKVGYVIIIEKCYVLIGSKLREQSLHFSALEKIINLEREENIIRLRYLKKNKESSEPRFRKTALISSNRHAIIQALQSKLRLTPEQRKRVFSKKVRKLSVIRSYLPKISGNVDKFEIDLSVGYSSKVSIPIPFPRMSGEWGFAALLRSIKAPNLLMVLKLLLMERSILIIGTGFAEVTASVSALLELLQPYKWASAFMPLLPESMLDIVGSPVPFIVGVVGNTTKDLDTLQSDSRVRDAIQEGMSVINLDANNFLLTEETIVRNTIRNCHNPISQELRYYQSLLDAKFKSGQSSFESFKLFFRNGASEEEKQILEGIRSLIKNYLTSLSGTLAVQIDGYKDFGHFEKDSFDFFPDKFLEPLRAQLSFQETMANTQLFLSHIEERKNRHDILEGPYAQFIADWLKFRIRCRKIKHEALGTRQNSSQSRRESSKPFFKMLKS